MNWHERNSMVSYSAINLRPGATSTNSDTRSTTWPNLGYRINGNTISPAIDPRPLPLQRLAPIITSGYGYDNHGIAA